MLGFREQTPMVKECPQQTLLVTQRFVRANVVMKPTFGALAQTTIKYTATRKLIEHLNMCLNCSLQLQGIYFFRRFNIGYNRSIHLSKETMKTLNNLIASYTLWSANKFIDFATKTSIKLAFGLVTMLSVLSLVLSVVLLKVIF